MSAGFDLEIVFFFVFSSVFSFAFIRISFWKGGLQGFWFEFYMYFVVQ
jgi:hypothetical protein